MHPKTKEIYEEYQEKYFKVPFYTFAQVCRCNEGNNSWFFKEKE